MNGIHSSTSSTGKVIVPKTDLQQPDTKTISSSNISKALGSEPRSPVTSRQVAKQTLSSPSLSTLKGTQGKGVSTNPVKLQQAQAKQSAGLPKQIGITIPPSSRAVNLDSRMMADEIRTLPKNQRKSAIANAQSTLQTRVNNGYNVYQNILNGTAKTPATQTDIRDFMTFLTAKASQKTAYFSNGSFNLPDPGNKIRDFLDSSKEVYQRSSTHIQGFSDHPGCGHRGIDLKLPHGMGTLLYGAMKDGVMETQGDRIFLKMEDHGCRFSTLTKDKEDTQGPQSRPKRFFSDLISSLKHGWGGLKTKLGLQKTKGTRKERVEKDVANKFKALIQMAKTGESETVAKLLNKHNPAGKETGYGVRTMIDNIDALLESDHAGLADLSSSFKNALNEFKNELEARYDHLEHRIGNEIVFDSNELNN